MFNHYSVRPIGSKQFENHLAYLMMKGIETEKTIRESLPEIPVVLRKDPTDDQVRYDPMEVGWKRLELAICAQAVWDYLNEYEQRIRCEDNDRPEKAYVHECRCLTMENEYFRETEERSALLDRILRDVIHRDYKVQHRLNRIHNAMHTVQRMIY